MEIQVYINYGKVQLSIPESGVVLRRWQKEYPEKTFTPVQLQVLSSMISGIHINGYMHMSSMG